MTVGLVVSSTDYYWGCSQVTVPNRLEYCLRWQLGFEFRYIPECVPYRELAWLDTLKNYDWVWAQGSDVIITNMTIDCRKYCYDDSDVVITTDAINGINDDSIFFRNTEATRNLLTEMIRIRPQFSDEQAALAYLIGQTPPHRKWDIQKIEPKIEGLRPKLVFNREFNSYPGCDFYGIPDNSSRWFPGDFVAHFPGVPFHVKIPRMEQMLKTEIVR